MSEASPQDLAVSFRSIPRRLREAGADVPPDSAGPIGREIEARLQAAGTLMRTTAEPAAIAAAIEAVRPKEWDEAALDSLRATATEIGTLLRRLGDLRPDQG